MLQGAADVALNRKGRFSAKRNVVGNRHDLLLRNLDLVFCEPAHPAELFQKLADTVEKPPWPAARDGQDLAIAFNVPLFLVQVVIWPQKDGRGPLLPFLLGNDNGFVVEDYLQMLLQHLWSLLFGCPFGRGSDYGKIRRDVQSVKSRRYGKYK